MQNYEQQSSQNSSSQTSQIQAVNIFEEQIPKKDKKHKKKNKNQYRILLNISDCQYAVVTRVAKKLGWKLQSSSQATDWDVLWTDNAVQPQTLAKMEQHQKINHFPGMFNLARKNLLGRGLMKLRKKFPEQYHFFPLTWMLPVEFHQLKQYFENKQKGKARTFIVKPQALSQGKGIFLTRKLQDIDPYQHCVVQRYLHKPYLIEGLKFDLRIYVLLAGVDPLRLYLFNQGLGRFATEKYEAPTKQNMQDTCMHLTNYAINKDNPKFIFNKSQKDMSKGHKRSLTSVLQSLKANSIDTDQLMNKIKDSIVKTILSALPILKSTYRACQGQNHASDMCFQLLGFDVMLTQKCQPVLLQINHTPSFSTDTPLDNFIKFNYIKDSLNLMNINEKRRNAIVKSRKQACQQRIITGKKVKLTPQEREKLKLQQQNYRDKYQKQNLGGFQKIYPCQNQERMKKYQQIMQYTEDQFQTVTGNKRAGKTVPTPMSKQKEKQKDPIKNKAIIPNVIKKPTVDFIKANMVFPKKYDLKNTQYKYESNRQLSYLIDQNYLQKQKQIIGTYNNIESAGMINEYPLSASQSKYANNQYPGSYNTISNSHNSLNSAKTVAQISNSVNQTNYWLDQEFSSQKNINNFNSLNNNINIHLSKKVNNNYANNAIKYPANLRFYQQKTPSSKLQNPNPLKSNLLKMNNIANQNRILIKETNTQYIMNKDKQSIRRNLTSKKDNQGQYRALSTQQSKIPMTLNTLLISGFEPTSSVSINNLKKILNQQKYKNHE